MAHDTLSIRAKLTRQSFALDVAFDVSLGETLALVGPSGAGKSTCVAAVAGLLRLECGRVGFDDEVWCDTSLGIDCPPHRRRIGFVHQDYALFPNLNVRDNVAYGARARRSSRPIALAKASEWLERLGIGEFADRPVGALSGGQRQRVALARALASGARVLLLDEPFGSLDLSTRNVVRRQLRGFLRDVQLPTVLVTHDPTDALTLAERIAILEDGHIRQTGTCEELLTRPQTPFVAELFGLNFFRAVLPPGQGLREAVVGGTVFHVIATDHEGPVALAFAPSAVTLSIEKPEGSAQNTFLGTVLEIIPLMERIRVMLNCGVTVAADVVRDAAVTLDLVRGRTVWASVKATAIQVYPT
ncbi:MAG: ABC transporter ATP-binding protein [candidate division Zixibacteria bacterium]|nr:ABC transporter ATP-binding protein [candidate division Zixibacteria bacterium]